MKIKDLFRKNKQQPQQEYISIKYSTLDNIGKVSKIPIIQHQTINNIKNDIAETNNTITGLNSKVNKIVNDLSNTNLANYKGNYSSSITYRLGDLVSETTTNNVYLSIKNDNINHSVNDTDYWKVITFTVDTSNFITNRQLEQRLKTHNRIFRETNRQRVNCTISTIKEDNINQYYLYWYTAKGSLRIPTLQVDPVSNYYVIVFANSVNRNVLNTVAFSGVVPSTSTGSLSVNTDNNVFYFGMDRLLGETGRDKYLEFEFTTIAFKITIN